MGYYGIYVDKMAERETVGCSPGLHVFVHHSTRHHPQTDN